MPHWVLIPLHRGAGGSGDFGHGSREIGHVLQVIIPLDEGHGALGGDVETESLHAALDRLEDIGRELGNGRSYSVEVVHGIVADEG